MADYTLPSFEIRGETYSIQLLNAGSGLTVPTKSFCNSIGKRVERMQDNTAFGLVMPENIRFDFVDVGGFFAQLFENECDIWLKRNNADEFYGWVNRDTIEWGEYYVKDEDVRRNVSFTAVNQIMKIAEKPVDELITSLLASSYIEDDGTVAFVKVVGILEHLMVEVFGPFTTPNIVNEDFQYRDPANNVYTFEDLYVRVGSIVASTLNPEWYFDENDNEYLGVKFSNCLDLISEIAMNFGFTPRITREYDGVSAYGYVLSLHTLRNRSLASVAAPPYLATSRKKTISSEPKSVLVNHDFFNSINERHTWYNWFYTKGSEVFSGNSAPPSKVEFDITISLLWFYTEPPSAEAYNRGWRLYVDNGSSWVYVTSGRSFQYATNDWTAYFATHAPIMSLYWEKQWSVETEEYERTYKGFSSNTILKTLEMHNGVEDRDYFINSFERDYMNKNETYTLIEV